MNYKHSGNDPSNQRVVRSPAEVKRLLGGSDSEMGADGDFADEALEQMRAGMRTRGELPEDEQYAKDRWTPAPRCSRAETPKEESSRELPRCLTCGRASECLCGLDCPHCDLWGRPLRTKGGAA